MSHFQKFVKHATKSQALRPARASLTASELSTDQLNNLRHSSRSRWKHFATIGKILPQAAESQQQKFAHGYNVSASLSFHVQRTRDPQEVKTPRHPRINSSSLQERLLESTPQGCRSFHSKVSTHAENRRCRKNAKGCTLGSLFEMVAHTPMGRLLLDKPGNSSLLGTGRRASTLRNRVHAVRRFLSWLAPNFNLSYQAQQEHYTDYLQVRLSEQCSRGALRLVHLSFIFRTKIQALKPTKEILPPNSVQ